MSGPKVFRVVTREEVIAICQGHLARVDAAVAEWMKAAQQRGAASRTDIDAAQSWQRALHRLLAEDRFTELQKQVPSEILFLQSDVQTLRDRAAAAEVAERQARRRANRTAEMLLRELHKAARAIPDDLRRALQSGNPSEVNHAVNRAFQLLSDKPSAPTVTERQRAIATQLGHGEARMTLAEWIEKQPSGDERGALQIDQHLAALSAFNVDAAPFERRASDLSQEPSAERRALLADSLVIDLAAALRTARDRGAILARLLERKIELSQMNTPEAKSVLSGIDRALDASDAATSSDLVKQADALLSDHMHRVASDARRQAILKGLSSLGYEVSEGMATAWVQDGRVVLRKAASPEYGVELGGGIQSERLQVRAIAFGTVGAARDVRRDRDMEAIWCNEFDELDRMIRGEGGGINIENALSVGAAPFKVIEDTTVGTATDVELPIAQTLKH